MDGMNLVLTAIGERKLPPNLNCEVGMHPNGSFLIGDTSNKLLLRYEWDSSTRRYNLKMSTNITDDIMIPCRKTALPGNTFALQNGAGKSIILYPELDQKIDGSKRRLLGATPGGMLIYRDYQPSQVINFVNPADGLTHQTLYNNFPSVWSWSLKVCTNDIHGYAVADEDYTLLDLIDTNGKITRSVPLKFTPTHMVSSEEYLFIAQRGTPARLHVLNWSGEYVTKIDDTESDAFICGLAFGDGILHIAYGKDNDTCYLVRAHKVDTVTENGMTWQRGCDDDLNDPVENNSDCVHRGERFTLKALNEGSLKGINERVTIVSTLPESPELVRLADRPADECTMGPISEMCPPTIEPMTVRVVETDASKETTENGQLLTLGSNENSLCNIVEPPKLILSSTMGLPSNTMQDNTDEPMLLQSCSTLGEPQPFDFEIKKKMCSGNIIGRRLVKRPMRVKSSTLGKPFEIKKRMYSGNTIGCPIFLNDIGISNNEINVDISNNEINVESDDTYVTTVEPSFNDNDSQELRLEKLSNCIRKYDYKGLECILQHEACRNCLNIKNRINGRAPLFSAILCNDAKKVNTLLSYGADVNTQDISGNTPLHVATMWRLTEIVKTLLQNIHGSNTDIEPINPNVPNLIFRTPLFYCATLDCLNLLLSNSYIDLNVTDQDGNTVLYECGKLESTAHDDPLSIMNTLLYAGANPNIANKENLTPLHASIYANNIRKVEALLKHGADPLACDTRQNTYLHHVVRLPHNVMSDMTRIFIETDLDPCLFNCDNETALHVLLECKQVVDINTVMLFVERKPEIMTMRNKNGDTCLHLAAKRKDSAKLFDVLLDKSSAGLNVVNNSSKTPVDIALEYGNVDNLQCIMRKRTYNISNASGENALHWALKLDSDFDLILDTIREVNPHLINCSNSDIETPLMIACRSGNIGAVKTLLSHDADLDTINFTFETALDIAIQTGNENIIRELLKKDPSLLNTPCHGSGFPLFQAVEYRQTGAVETILEIYKRESHLANNLVNQLYSCTTDMKISQNVEKLIEAIRQQEQDVVKPLAESCIGKPIFEYESTTFETTPFRETIQYTPDMASTILDKCLSRSGAVYFGFINKGMGNPIDALESLTENVVSGSRLYSKSLEQETLRDICTSEYPSLIDHPVFRMLVRPQWGITLILYSLFIAFYVTHVCLGVSYMLLQNPPGFGNATQMNGTVVKPTQLKIISYMIYCTSTVGIFLEVFQLVSMCINRSWSHYFKAFDNYVDILSYVIPILIVSYATQDGHMANWQWQLGVACIFVSSLNVLYLCRVYPAFGIYILMILLMMRNLFKFFAVILVIVLIFAVCFHLLIPNQQAFATVPTSVVKNWVMMIGEMDFMDIFHSGTDDPNSAIRFREFAWMLYCFFLVFVSLVVMNLVTSLAVIGVEDLLEKSRLKITITQCELTLKLDTMIPKSIWNVLYTRESKTYGYIDTKFRHKKAYSNDWIKKFFYGQLLESEIRHSFLDILDRQETAELKQKFKTGKKFSQRDR